jgi:hypothetical protein
MDTISCQMASDAAAAGLREVVASPVQTEKGLSLDGELHAM